MTLTPETFLFVCPLVFFAGLVDAIAGGGGLISLPAYLAAGVPPHLALGTNKLSSSLGTLSAACRYLKAAPCSWRVGAVCVAGALAGAPLGSRLALLVPDGVLRAVLLFIMPVAAAAVLLGGKLFRRAETQSNPLPPGKLLPLCLAISFTVGMYDGFYGPGTGTFLLLLFVLLCRMTVREASTVTKVVNLSSNLGALAVFLLNGSLVPLLGLAAAVFSILGNLLGARLVLRRGVRAVRPMMLIVLTLLLIKLIFDF